MKIPVKVYEEVKDYHTNLNYLMNSEESTGLEWVEGVPYVVTVV